MCITYTIAKTRPQNIFRVYQDVTSSRWAGSGTRLGRGSDENNAHSNGGLPFRPPDRPATPHGSGRTLPGALGYTQHGTGGPTTLDTRHHKRSHRLSNVGPDSRTPTSSGALLARIVNSCSVFARGERCHAYSRGGSGQITAAGSGEEHEGTASDATTAPMRRGERLARVFHEFRSNTSGHIEL